VNREQIYAVLLGLVDDTLLLPNAAVAEVLSRENLRPSGPGVPPWLAGYCAWNNRSLPVVSFEGLNGAPPADMTRRARVVVINSLGTHLPTGLFALVAQGYPHLVTLNRSAVAPGALRNTDRSDLILSRAKIANQEAVIPDLDTIEAEISRLQTTG
jgi:chemosensory pili system protein ChpC